MVDYAVLLFVALVFFIAVGTPICFAIELTGVIFLLVTQMKPLIVIAQRSFSGMDNYSLLAIPLFTLAGYLMDQGGLSKRLVSWVEAVFGGFPGSSGTITIICCTVFAALTGSGPATVAAIGAIMIPAMAKAGYSKETSSGLLAAGGALGPIIPPSILMICYATTMSVSIPAMFLGGIIPGLLISCLFIVTNTIIAVKQGIHTETKKRSIREILSVTYHAFGVLMLPVIVLGGIYGGIFTPTEAAAICVIYSLILGFAYRELNATTVINAFTKAVETSGMIVMITGMSSILTWILASARIPDMIANAVTPYLTSQYVYLFILMLILFTVGCFMDSMASVYILGPILVPIGIAIGIDPLHLAITFCVNLIVGFITPPFGVNLFASAGVSGVPFVTVVKGILPFLVAAVIGAALVTFIPALSTFLPIMAGLYK